MSKINLNKKAFTLVELLIVIAIIGLIAAVSIIALGNARSKSRDTKRVTDIKQIQTALGLFFGDTGRYHTVDEWNTGSLFSTSSTGTTTYMNRIPVAPGITDGDCDRDRANYSYYSYNGSTYSLSFCLGSVTGSFSSGIKLATPLGIGII